MTNAEKYKDAIMAQMCKTGDWAVNQSGEITPCVCVKCANCEFNIKLAGCIDMKKDWLNAEVKKVFSEKDKEVLRAMDKVQWVARDEDGLIFGFVTKPKKGTSVWRGVEPCICISSYCSSATFADIKWEDDEPTSREEIWG